MKTIQKICIPLLTLTLLTGTAGCGSKNAEESLPSNNSTTDTQLSAESPAENHPLSEQASEAAGPALESQDASLPAEEIITVTDPNGNVLFQGTEREIFYQKLDLCGENDYAHTADLFIEEYRGVTDVSGIYHDLLDTDEKYYTKEELSEYDETILWLAKNEIYARHGRMFANEELYEYFLTRMWYEPIYSPDEFDENCFNDYEKKNLALLVELENGSGSASTSSPSTSSGNQAARALKGEIIELSGGSWTWDLDRNGEEETIQYEKKSTSSFSEYHLQVGSDSVTEDGESIVDHLYITSIDGKTYQLLVFQYGPSDDPQIDVWCWNGSNLVHAGYLFSYLEDVYISDHHLFCREQSNIIQTIYVDMEYKLDGVTLKVIDHEMYPMGNFIIAKQDIPTYKEKGGTTENGCVLKAGSEVLVVGTDNHSWVKLQDMTTGDICWMKVVEGTYDTMLVSGEEYYITELFDKVRQVG